VRDDVLDDGVVTLRPWRHEDADWYVSAVSDPEIQRFTTESATLRPDEVRAAIDQLRATDNQVGFAIVDTADGRLLGNIALALDGGVGEISYWIAVDSRGRGAASRALALLANWAFTRAGVSELRLHAHRDNIASQRVAERAGFVRDAGRDGFQDTPRGRWPMVAFAARR
jgi:RimJ/RimL family protein N-acetyltransferase